MKKSTHRLFCLLVLVLFLLAIHAMFDSVTRSLLYPAPRLKVGEPPAPLVEVRLELEGGEIVIAWALENPRAGEETPAVVDLLGRGVVWEERRRCFRDL